ncbi:MAG: dual specificity protein phosphatase family protein [Cyanobacteria bacterium]|nr:dual specificity protein phosphatase family protein [Cyanobacteriota bacterium]
MNRITWQTIADRFNLPVPQHTNEITADHMLRVAELIEESRQGGNGVFVHCAHGRDRTGAAIATWRMRHQGWTAQRAANEMLNYGYNNNVNDQAIANIHNIINGTGIDAEYLRRD